MALCTSDASASRSESKDQCSVKALLARPDFGTSRRRFNVSVPPHPRGLAQDGLRAAYEASAGKDPKKSMIELIDEEIELLRPAVNKQALRCESIEQELEKVCEEELVERKNVLRTRDFRKARAHSLAKKLQATIRGWLARKRFILTVNKELADQAGFVALLPDQLHDQLRDLRHTVHDLEYREEHRQSAALRVQAWWRGTLHRRVVFIFRVASIIRCLHSYMEETATVVSSWERGKRMRLKYREEIFEAMQRTVLEKKVEHLKRLGMVVKLQRAFRAKLAMKMVAQERSRLLALGIQFETDCKKNAEKVHPNTVSIVVDTWRPGGFAGNAGSDQAAHLAAATGIGPKSLDDLGSVETELQMLEKAGLTPFYWSSQTDFVRHKVGGPSAQKMGRKLGIGTIEDWRVPSDDELEKIGSAPWDAYPVGFSDQFFDELDEDAWPWPRPRNKESRRKREVEPPSAAKRLTRPLSPPSNARRRALLRDETAQAKSVFEGESFCGSDRDRQEDGLADDAHPLFENAPLLPPIDAVTPRRRPFQSSMLTHRRVGGKPAVPRLRNIAAGDAEEEASWSMARNFEYCPRQYRDKREFRPIDSHSFIANFNQLALAY